jgi:hypothetical protein
MNFKAAAAVQFITRWSWHVASAVVCCPTFMALLLHAADIHLCHQASTRQRMVQYAHDQDFFFKAYADGFDKLGALGYKAKDLSEL